MNPDEIKSAIDALAQPRTPTAFIWTPAMEAIWPRDMRPTMSGLLARWEAMHEAAVYEDTTFSTTDFYTTECSPKVPVVGEDWQFQSIPVADLDGWIAHDGSEKPNLPMDTIVQVKFRDGTVAPAPHFKVGFWYSQYRGANNFVWSGGDDGAEIIAYRVIPEDGPTDTPEIRKQIIADIDGWIPHKPGDPMPCDGGVMVDVRFDNGKEYRGNSARFWELGASSWRGGGMIHGDNITHWRPAK